MGETAARRPEAEHGREGATPLRDARATKHISVDRIPMGEKDPLQFPCTEKSYAWFKKGLRLMFGGGSLAKRIGDLF